MSVQIVKFSMEEEVKIQECLKDITDLLDLDTIQLTLLDYKIMEIMILINFQVSINGESQNNKIPLINLLEEETEMEGSEEVLEDSFEKT